MIDARLTVRDLRAKLVGTGPAPEPYALCAGPVCLPAIYAQRRSRPLAFI